MLKAFGAALAAVLIATPAGAVQKLNWISASGDDVFIPLQGVKHPVFSTESIWTQNDNGGYYEQTGILQNFVVGPFADSIDTPCCAGNSLKPASTFYIDADFFYGIDSAFNFPTDDGGVGHGYFHLDAISVSLEYYIISAPETPTWMMIILGAVAAGGGVRIRSRRSLAA